MAFDLLPRRVISLPTLQSLWDDEDWITPTASSGGLSVSEDESHVYIEAAVPGINPKDVEITYQDGYLWVRGETQEEEKDKKRKYYRQASRSFSYRIAVPGEVDSAKDPEASYRHGIMTVTFAKSPKVQPKKIQVKSVSE